jgi:diacylglycerol kinase family enzyme
MQFIGVFNRDGGTFRQLDMDDFVRRATLIFAEAGHLLDCRPVGGKQLIAELERAARDKGADVVLAGGGDGTISAAAAICYRAAKPLAVLPAGTMNLFARTLRTPLNLDEALKAVAGGQMVDVDIATANDRPFVHQYSVGLHARLVRIREEMPYENRWQKTFASILSVRFALSKQLKFQVDVVSASGREQRIASGVIVSNNPLAEGHIPHADDVDAGVLGVYLAKPMNTFEALQLFARVALGHWKGHPRVTEREVKEVTLTFPHRKRSARAVIDGELVPLPLRVDLKIHPKALKVFAPQALAAFVAEKNEGPVPSEERGPDVVA